MKLLALILAVALAGCVHVRGAFQGDPEVPPTFTMRHECLFFEEGYVVLGFQHGKTCGQVILSVGEWRPLTRKEIVEAVHGDYMRGAFKVMPCDGGKNGPIDKPGNPSGDTKRPRFGLCESGG